VFALVNGLARDGKLTAQQEQFRRENNAWYHAHLTDPGAIDATAYDRVLHPGAVAWFKTSAGLMIDRVEGYLGILTAHGVEWCRVHSSDPGQIVYEDVHQVVAVPCRTR
jgi:hypothetical protein